MVTTEQQAAAQSTSRAERQAQQLAANQAASEAFEKASSPTGGGLGTGGYGEARTAPDQKKFTNIDLSSPAGRALYEAYKQSGVVFDSDTGNVIYNPVDLGAREVEVARAAQGLSPSSKTIGEPSAQYSYNVAKQSSGQVTQLRSQFEQLQKEKAYSQDVIRNTEANIKQLQGQLAEAQRIMNDKQADSLLFSLRAEERQLARYKKNVQNIDTAIKQTAQAEIAAKKKQVQSTIQFAEESGRITEGPRPIKNAFGATSSKAIQTEPVIPQRPRAKAVTGVKEKLFASPTYMQDAETYTRPQSFLGETRKKRPKALSGVKEKLFAAPNYIEYGQEPKGKTNAFQIGKDVTISLTENISTQKQRAPQAFAVSLSEGVPPKPRKLSQTQVDQMTPEQYVVYKAEFDAYNRYVQQQNQLIKKENVRNLRESLANLKSFIDAEKAKGTKTIVIVTDEGERRIPIGEAYLGIQRTKNIKSIYTDIVIPEGYTVAGPIATPIFVPEKGFTTPEPEKTDPLSRGLKGLEQYKAVVGPVGPRRESEASILYKEAAAGTALQFGSTVAFFTGELQGIKNTLLSPKTPIANIIQTERERPYIAETGSGAALGTPIIELVRGERDTSKILTKTKEEVGRVYEKLGPAKFGGTVIGAAIELLNPIKGAKAIKSGVVASAKGISKIIPKKEAATIPARLARREGTEILEPIKPYQQSKLRNQGFEERPELKAGFTPQEEKAIQRAFNIPEPLVKEAGLVSGARDYGNLRKIIEGIKEPEKPKITQPVRPEPYYTPSKPDITMIAPDTAIPFKKTEVPLGAGIITKVEESRGPLGGQIIKEIVTKPFRQKTIPLGSSTTTITKTPLGKSPVRIITSFGENTTMPLGVGRGFVETIKKLVPKDIEFPKQFYKIRKTKEVEAVEDLQRLIEKPGFKQKPVEEEFGYSPQKELPITRAKEIKTYKVQTKDLLGKTENPLKDIFAKAKTPLVKEGTAKPGLRMLEKKAELEKEFPQLLQKKAFERSVEYAEKIRVEYPFVGTDIKLGAAIAKKYTVSKVPTGFVRDLVDLGRGKGFYVSRATGESGLKRFTKPPEPPKEGPSKGAQQLILEKPGQTKFKSVQVQLGEGKGAVVAAGGTAAVPAIPLTKAIAENENIPNIINGTGTNQTDVEIVETTPSILEPEQVSEARSDVFAAAQTPQSGQLYGIEAAKARRVANKTIIQVTPIQRERQRQQFGLPTPSAQPSKLTQPAAFKQPEKQKFRSLFPSPQPLQPGLKQPFPFPEPIIPIEILRTPPPRIPPRLGRPFPPVPKPIKTPKKGKKKKPNNFLGNASEEEIALGFNRTEIITGIERTERQLKKDITFTRKVSGITEKFVTQRTGSVLSKKKQSILEREKPKDVAKFKRKTGGFF